MANELKINRLPAKTWNWLHVNETKLEWDLEQTQWQAEETIFAAAGEQKAPVRLSIAGEQAYNGKRVHLRAEENSSMTVLMDLRTAAHLAVHTEIQAESNGKIRLIQIQYTGEQSVLYSDIQGVCGAGGQIELIQIFLGRGDVYADCTVNLVGDGSDFQADMGYLAQKTQKLDMNTVVNHIGKKTTSRIQADGALKDSAEKLFRGTIDFKQGASESEGNEQENVILLGEDIVNRTVPLILCAEESVVGNHGATIGELDDDLLFYFESRGIDRKTAENMMARAALDRLIRLIDDETVRETAERQLEEVLVS